MNTPDKDRIDELIDRLDSFMSNGGGHMNIKNTGEGTIVTETHCSTCCGESADKPCHAEAADDFMND